MHRTFSKAVCIPAFFIVLFLFAIPASADSGWVTTTVSDNTTNALGGEISGDYIVSLAGAEGLDQSQNRVYLYAIPTGENKIIGSPSANMTVTDPDVSGEYAVWFETPIEDFSTDETDPAPNRAYFYSLRNGSAEVLDVPGTAEWPKIDGGRVIWLDESSDSLDVRVSLYDIGTGKSEPVCELSVIDPAGVCFDGDNIVYLSMEGLYLYSLETGANTTVFRNVFGNESGSDIESYALGGDYLIYLKHTVNFEGPDKGMFDEPYLYRISTGETRRLDPLTGGFSESSNTTAKDEKDLTVSSPFTDGEGSAGYIRRTHGIDDRPLRSGDRDGRNGPGGRPGHPPVPGRRPDGVGRDALPVVPRDLIYAQENVSATETAPASAPGSERVSAWSPFWPQWCCWRDGEPDHSPVLSIRYVYIAASRTLKCPWKWARWLMLFIALAKFKTQLSEDVIARNLKDIETDTEGEVRYLGIYWTLGRYDSVILFEAPDEKAAMNVVLRRADRMKIETLVAVPADAGSPAGPT
jgi:uncharacterized protein with GYD domain